jgi:hypothetical protein
MLRCGPLVVSCRTKGRGLLISERTRPHSPRLYRLIGPHLSIGFSNHTTSPVKIHTTFTFK